MRPLLFVSVCLLAGSAGALAQPVAPPGPFVIDARGAFTNVGRSEELAAPRGLMSSELPKTVLGFDVGAHFYPVRGKVTLGVGGSLLMVGGTQTPGEPEEGAVDPPITPGEFRVRGIVPQVSLNFGSSRGWSYIGGGVGFSQMKAGRAESDLTYSPQLLTINLAVARAGSSASASRSRSTGGTTAWPRRNSRPPTSAIPPSRCSSSALA